MLNIGRCVLGDFLMKKVTRFPIINLRRNWFCPCEFLVWNRSICQRRNLRGFFSLSSISVVFLWQVHVCVCQRSSKGLRNETVYDIVTSYERLHVHLHLHKLFKCSRFTDSQHHIDATTVTLTRNIKKLQTHKVNRRTFPAYLCLCWLSSVSNFIYPDKNGIRLTKLTVKK